MSTAADSRRRELHRRTNDGFDVRLLWDPECNRVFVAVEDQREADSFEIEADPAEALDAFYHPFAYTRDERDLGAPPRDRCLPAHGSARPFAQRGEHLADEDVVDEDG